MSDDPPQLSLASSNDPEEVRRQWDRERCIDGVEWDTRELAANMLRVMRGAGRPHDLIDQVMSIANRLEQAPEGVTVLDALEAMWAALQDGLRDRDDLDGGIDVIESGVARSIAGRLVKQQTQASAGRTEMFNGIRIVERARERNRKEMTAVSRAMPKARAKRTKVAMAIVAGKIPPMPPAAQIKLVIAESPPEPKTTADYLRINAKRIREGKPTI